MESTTKYLRDAAQSLKVATMAISVAAEKMEAAEGKDGLRERSIIIECVALKYRPGGAAPFHIPPFGFSENGIKQIVKFWRKCGAKV